MTTDDTPLTQRSPQQYAWSCRHELSGPEQDAGLRALGQLGGRVFEGGPAPPVETQAIVAEQG